MAPVVAMDLEHEKATNEDSLYFEASILHRIPAKLAAPISASSIFSSDTFQEQNPIRQLHQSLLLKRKKIHHGRLRKLAKFQAELTEVKRQQDDDLESDNDDDDDGLESDDDIYQNEIVRRKELLISVILRTMVLIHYNRQFQNTINAFQKQVREFVRLNRRTNDNNDTTTTTTTTNNNNNNNNKFSTNYEVVTPDELDARL